jgi:hypothetical protein
MLLTLWKWDSNITRIMPQQFTSVSLSNQPSYQLMMWHKNLAGEWPKCNHSNTPCNCQSAPMGIDGEHKISNWTGWCGSQCWSWAVVIVLSTLTKACRASSISSQSKEGLGLPLSSWKRGDKLSVVSFREGLSQLISPGSFCKLSFLSSTFWGWIKRPLITCPKYDREALFVPFLGQCTIPRPQGPL